MNRFTRISKFLKIVINRYRKLTHAFSPYLSLSNSLKSGKRVRLDSFPINLGATYLPFNRFLTLTPKPIYMILSFECSLGVGSLHLEPDSVIRSPNPSFRQTNTKEYHCCCCYTGTLNIYECLFDRTIHSIV